MTDPENRRVYEEEAAKKELWLQLVEARMSAGLTQEQLAKRLGVSQAQVARIEKRGYDAYTLNSLRRYVDALGEGFQLEVRVRQSDTATAAPAVQSLRRAHVHTEETSAHPPRKPDRMSLGRGEQIQGRQRVATHGVDQRFDGSG